jgi:hypothetical protein
MRGVFHPMMIDCTVASRGVTTVGHSLGSLCCAYPDRRFVLGGTTPNFERGLRGLPLGDGVDGHQLTASPQA